MLIITFNFLIHKCYSRLFSSQYFVAQFRERLESLVKLTLLTPNNGYTFISGIMISKILDIFLTIAIFTFRVMKVNASTQHNLILDVVLESCHPQYAYLSRVECKKDILGYPNSSNKYIRYNF